MPHRIGIQIAGSFGELKAVRVGQRENNVILGCSRLQLEIEGPAEALAQRQAPGSVDPAAEWRVNYQLHAAGFVEKALEYDGIQRRQGAERSLARAQVLHDLKRGSLIETHGLHQPLERSGRIAPEALFDFLAKIRNRCRQFHTATG